MNEVLQSVSPDELLEQLPPSSRSQLRTAIQSGSAPNRLALALASSPGIGLATKGSSQWPKDFGERIVSELRLLLCTDDPKYASARKRLRNEGTISARVMVTVVAGAVGHSLGFAASLLVPPVALFLYAAATVGLAAWCGSSSDAQGTESDDASGEPQQRKT